MSITDFIKYFDSVTICIADKNLKVERINNISNTNFETNAFRLRVGEKKEYYIKLFFDDNDRKFNEIDLFLVIMSIISDSSGGVKINKIAQQTKTSYCRSVNLNCELIKGDYLIVPMSFKYWKSREKAIKFNLVIHSFKSIDLHLIKSNASLYSHIIIQKCLMEEKKYALLIKKIDDEDGDACIYEIRMIESKTNVTFIIAINENKNKQFSVQLKMKPTEYKCVFTEKNTNENFEFLKTEDLYTTRDDLETKDIIQPLNKKVIAVINHTRNFKNSFELESKNIKNYIQKEVRINKNRKIDVIKAELLVVVSDDQIFFDSLHTNVSIKNNVISLKKN